jgi:hypothetical protein
LCFSVLFFSKYIYFFPHWILNFPLSHVYPGLICLSAWQISFYLVIREAVICYLFSWFVLFVCFFGVIHVLCAVFLETPVRVRGVCVNMFCSVFNFLWDICRLVMYVQFCFLWWEDFLVNVPWESWEILEKKLDFISSRNSWFCVLYFVLFFV